jgi:hypothetical protein
VWRIQADSLRPSAVGRRPSGLAIASCSRCAGGGHLFLPAQWRRAGPRQPPGERDRERRLRPSGRSRSRRGRSATLQADDKILAWLWLVEPVAWPAYLPTVEFQPPYFSPSETDNQEDERALGTDLEPPPRSDGPGAHRTGEERAAQGRQAARPSRPPSNCTRANPSTVSPHHALQEQSRQLQHPSPST